MYIGKVLCFLRHGSWMPPAIGSTSHQTRSLPPWLRKTHQTWRQHKSPKISTPPRGKQRRMPGCSFCDCEQKKSTRIVFLFLFFEELRRNLHFWWGSLIHDVVAFFGGGLYYLPPMIHAWIANKLVCCRAWYHPSQDESNNPVSGPEWVLGDDRWVVKGESMITILDQDLGF